MAISLLESVQLGLADIKTRKVRTGVTILGIILGVMSIMVVLAIVNGVNVSTLEWMSERGGLTKVEVHRNWGMDFKDWNKATFSQNELKYIRSQIPEAVAFTPEIDGRQMEVSRGSIFFDATVRGVYPDMPITEEWPIGKGRFINYYDINNSLNVIVLGSTAANDLFGDKNPIGEYVYVKGQALQVIGVMRVKSYEKPGAQGFGNLLEYMNKWSFVPLTTMLHKISPGEKVSQLNVKAATPEEALVLQKKLRNIVLNLKQGKHYFNVESSKEQMNEMKKNGAIFSAVFVMIAVISLLVGGIVIMNIMLASVRERTREIGVRLAIGARRIDIFIQFMIQTVLITVLGGVIGIVLGYSILNMVGTYLQMELVASLSMVYAAIFVSVGVGLIFGIMPAVRASNLDPVTALRNE